MEASASCFGKSASFRPGGFLVLQPNAYICARKTRWQYFLLIFALLPALLVLNSCGASSTTPAVPTISMSCANTSINANATSQCTASIANLSSTVATWEVNTITSGNSTVGTIDTNGLYTAPAVVPTTNNGVVTITALAQAQTSLTATATITILPPAAISAITCLNSQGLPSQTVSPDSPLACTPTVSGGGNIAVFWYVNNSSACSSTLGSRDGNVNGTFPFGTVIAAGNQMSFSAPQIPPPGAAVAITAVSRADATQTLCLPLTLTFGNASLRGSYAFSTSGRVTSANSFFARAGGFTADGSGRIIAGGVEDINPQPGGGPPAPISFSGSYSIGADGRGTMAFCERSNNPCAPAGQTSQFRIVVLSPQQAQVIEFSPPNSTTALTAASGEMDLQDVSSFNTGSLLGTYTFGFAGLSSATTAQSEVGEFSANGVGGITSGEMDVNAGGGQSISNTSSYSISSNGRGIATIVTPGGPSTFSFYIISANRAKFIETDTFPLLIGDAFKQQSIVAWGLNSLNGPLVVQTAGSGAAGGVTDLVSFTSSGNGSVVAGSAMVDDNNAGAVTSTSSLGGSYTFDPSGNGRGTLSIAAHTYVFYMISTSSAVIQETTPGIVAHGSLVQPQGGPFALASLQTSFALSLSGTNAAGKEEDFVGHLKSDGAGTVTAGSLDINNFGATQTGVSNIGTYAAIAANGRTTMPLTQPQNLVLYFVSPTQVFAMVGADINHTVASGSLYKLF
jgi:hypothetical protein